VTRKVVPKVALPAFRTSATLAYQIPDGFSRAEHKALMQLKNRELTRGFVATVRVRAAATVADAAIQSTAALSRKAALVADGDPVVMNRANYIVDSFVAYVGDEISGFGR
jgi:precorrin-2 methylase